MAKNENWVIVGDEWVNLDWYSRVYIAHLRTEVGDTCGYMIYGLDDEGTGPLSMVQYSSIEEARLALYGMMRE
jgi:hypothetical protein